MYIYQSVNVKQNKSILHNWSVTCKFSFIFVLFVLFSEEHRYHCRWRQFHASVRSRRYWTSKFWSTSFPVVCFQWKRPAGRGRTSNWTAVLYVCSIITTKGKAINIFFCLTRAKLFLTIIFWSWPFSMYTWARIYFPNNLRSYRIIYHWVKLENRSFDLWS